MKEVKSPKKPLFYYYGITLLVILLFNLIVTPLLLRGQVTEVDYGTFMRMIEEKQIGKVEVESNQIVFTDKDNTTIYATGAMEDPTLTQRLYESGAKFTKDIEETTSPLLSYLLSFIVPILIFSALGHFMNKRLMEQAGGKNAMSFGMGKSNAKVYVQSTEGIHFSDVAGEDEAKENLAEIVDYLHNPKKYTEAGASMPKGLLLVGPPGTGKTMLARAVAGEAGVPFFSISGSEFVEMFVGMGASKVRDLFKQAKEKAPCIVFIDEIDAIGQKRNSGSIETVIAGYQKKNAVLSDEEKKVVAYHEIGHALVAAMQSHSAPVQKITIIPRTSGALGYTMQVDTGDKYLMTKKEIENKIATFTGGRAAEEIVFGEITTGASNDIEQATKLARAMITRYGMSEDFDMVAMETVTNQYLGGDATLACSADTQKEIDRKVVELVKAQHEKARRILTENRQKLDELSAFLYEKETITGEEFMAILNKGGKA